MFNILNIALSADKKTQIDNILLKLYGINTGQIYSNLVNLYNEYHICLKNESEMLVFHIRSISKDRLMNKLGKIETNEIDRAIKTLNI